MTKRSRDKITTSRPQVAPKSVRYRGQVGLTKTHLNPTAPTALEMLTQKP